MPFLGLNSWCRSGSEKSEFQSEYELLPDPITKADYIPLRLNPGERKLQRLMRGIMLASRYTDKVDQSTFADSTRRDMVIAKEITNVFTGFVVGDSIEAGGELLSTKDFDPYKESICSAIEVCRRYKILNPDMLRTDYVKFLYMVQDAMQNDFVRETLGFSVATKLVTVGSFCDEIHCREMLQERILPLCITPVPMMQDRTKLNKCLRCKDVSVDDLVKRYAKQTRNSAEHVEMIVRSLNDANHFANDNVESTSQMLQYLKHFFEKEKCDETSDLSIVEGSDGSRLSHNHSRQFTFVLQSLSLWKNICRRMFSLWIVAEEDMLNPDEKYVFRSTGQGYQRVQKAPNLYAAVKEVVEQTKAELGEWVGSERIHMGDDQVPNAFHFIDKYGQVSRIIIPILRTIDNIDKMEKNASHSAYIKSVWGGTTNAKRAILRDFFRFGFDGSGGDNMDDAGSCIDGRLTSAWNWCNNIRKKPFFPLFLFAGFSSFDGDLSI